MMVLGRYALNGQVQESLERLVIAKYYSPNDVTFGCMVDLFFAQHTLLLLITTYIALKT